MTSGNEKNNSPKDRKGKEGDKIGRQVRRTRSIGWGRAKEEEKNRYEYGKEGERRGELIHSFFN